MSEQENQFEPILNIPTMEELDQQWQEMQGRQNRGSSTEENVANKSYAASENRSGGRASGGSGSSRAVSGSGGRGRASGSAGGRSGSRASGSSGSSRNASGSKSTGRTSVTAGSSRTASGSRSGSRVPGGSNSRGAVGTGGRGTGRSSGISGDGRSAADKGGSKSHIDGSTGGGQNGGNGASPNTSGQGGSPKKGRKKKRFKKLRFVMKIFLLVLLLGVLTGLIIFYNKFGDDLLSWKKEAKQLVEESTPATFRSSETSIIYAANKKPIAKLRGDRDSSYLAFEDIPQEAIDCVIATEDRDFYEHSGISILSTAKASLLYVQAKLSGSESFSRGGSTITQQLAKLTFLSNEKTEERKIREMFIALELEKKYNKDQIMEFYMNNICFANGHFGLEAASKAYFSKPAKDLSLSEIVFLCAIPNRPEAYDPLKYFSNTNDRKERLLKQMLEEDKISAAEYSDAMYEKIILNPAEIIKTQDYMTTYAISCATKALMDKRGFEFRYKFANDAEREEYNDDYEEAYNECHSQLYTGGFQIYTTLSPAKQNKLQKSVNQALKGFTEKTKEGVYAMQGAGTCIDNETGFVVAIVGGRKQKNSTGYTLNRAFQSYRQPGSSFKPLAVYTPQLERNYTPDTIVDDTYFEGGPRNSDGTYSGKIPLRYAVEKSKNVIAWKLFEELTPKVGLNYVINMNFAQIVDNDYYPAASLGGLTNGVSTVEMASGYATIYNDGIFRTPTCIRKMTDSSGNTVISNVKGLPQKQVYEETAARTMTDILQGVLIRGTAAGKGLSNMPSAGKTGTTNDKKDGWFCGYTPYYSTAIWIGYDSPRTVSDLYGSTYPLTVWRDFMEKIHSSLERKEFKAYSSHNQNSNSSNNDDTYSSDTQESYEPEEEPTEEPDIIDEMPEPKVTKKPKVTKAPVPTEEPVETLPPDNGDDGDVGEPEDPVEDPSDDPVDIPSNGDDPVDIPPKDDGQSQEDPGAAAAEE